MRFVEAARGPHDGLTDGEEYGVEDAHVSPLYPDDPMVTVTNDHGYRVRYYAARFVKVAPFAAGDTVRIVKPASYYAKVVVGEDYKVVRVNTWDDLILEVPGVVRGEQVVKPADVVKVTPPVVPPIQAGDYVRLKDHVPYLAGYTHGRLYQVVGGPHEDTLVIFDDDGEKRWVLSLHERCDPFPPVSEPNDNYTDLMVSPEAIEYAEAIECMGGISEASAGVKHDAGKPRMELVAPSLMRAVATILTFGANKYAARNWEKGLHYGRAYGALQRHLQDWWDGVEVDPETGKSPLWHAATELMFLIDFEERMNAGTLEQEFDDRPFHVPCPGYTFTE